jgi:hypothetical protein
MRSKAWDFGRSLTGIVGSNPTGAWMFVLCLLYKDGSMERKVTWRTKGSKTVQEWIKGEKPRTEKKNSGGGEIFSSRPDQPWGPTSLLYNGYRVSFQGVKRPGRGVDHPPSSSARVKERVELYLYSPSWPSWPVIGRSLPLPFEGHTK